MAGGTLPESDLAFSSFTPRAAFPATFDGASTDDDHGGDATGASRFATGDKVAVQMWFGS